MMHAVDLEQLVLGAILVDRNVKGDVIPILHEDIFYHDDNRVIFRAMLRLYEQALPIDHVTVLEQLKTSGTLQERHAHYLTELSAKVATSANAEYHARIITEKWMRRRLMEVSGKFQNRANNEGLDIFDIVNDCHNDLMTISQFIRVGSNIPVSKIVDGVYEQAIKAKNNPGTLQGVPSGFADLDRVINGLKEPDLIIIAGRPSMGKTAFALNVASNASGFGNPVGIFSLEMSAQQLTARLLSMESGVSTTDLAKGKFDMSLTGAINRVKGHEIYLNDKAGMTTIELQTAARKMVSTHGVKLIMVDYLQLMIQKGNSREQEVSKISQSLKQLSKDLKVPVIALSQLSRKVEERGDKRPVLSDLRDSGSIEQDADIVMFLYRPEYYGIDRDESGQDMKGITELIIAKHRNGPLGTVNLDFKAETTTFKSHEGIW